MTLTFSKIHKFYGVISNELREDMESCKRAIIVAKNSPLLLLQCAQSSLSRTCGSSIGNANDKPSTVILPIKPEKPCCVFCVKVNKEPSTVIDKALCPSG
jgi:hypothetical protein